MTRSFFHTFQCEGYQAKLTIEWSAPEDIDLDSLPERARKAEEVASATIADLAARLKEIVAAMRGRTFDPPGDPRKSTEWQA